MTSRMSYVVAWLVTAATALLGTLIGGPIIGAIAALYVDLRGGSSTLKRYRSFGTLGLGAVIDVGSIFAGMFISSLLAQL